MQWEIWGADRRTGADVSITIEADNEDSARRRANRQNVLFEDLRAIESGDSVAGVALAAASPAHIPYAIPAFPRRRPRRRRALILASTPLLLLGSIAFGALWVGRRSTPKSPSYVGSSPPLASLMKAAASPPPIFSNVKPTEIAGAIWLTRKNGESAVQRGAKVVLLPVKVSKASVQGALQSEASSHDDEAQSHGKTAEGFNREFGNDSGYGERARASRAAAVSCRSAVATVTADMDTRSAYRVLKSHAILEIPSFSSVRAQNVIDEAEADVDGKYLFEM